MKALLLSVLLAAQSASADPATLQWITPPFVEGIASPQAAHPFWRLPARMQGQVRTPVWKLSLDSAGEFVHFRSRAGEIHVRYRLGSQEFDMPHMPTTGASGLDLFAVDENGDWNWVPGTYRFGVTSEFVFKPTAIAAANALADFYLYLPLYNDVDELQIGVDADATVKFVPKPTERPIVAYGTSIMQGAVASRPGLAWTNVLARRLDRTVVNLGFSGNGMYEAPLFELMAQTSAKLFILDCMPNLVDLDQADLQARLEHGLQRLRARQPDVPVLLAEYPNGRIPFYADGAQRNRYHQASLRMARVFDALQAEGYANLHLLTEQAVGLDTDSTTEGTHPNDIGMQKYAAAYETAIRTILDEPVGAGTLDAKRQYRDGYDWLQRHEAVKRRLQDVPAQHLIVGDSIEHFFGGEPAGRIARGTQAWQRYMQPLRVQNAGFGWDRIENVRWRLYHGEFDAFRGRDIVLMIGTNNLGTNTDDEVVAGVLALAAQFRRRFPAQETIISAILPRRGQEPRVAAINRRLAAAATADGVSFHDFGAAFLKEGTIDPSLFEHDGLHPSPAGYEVLGKQLGALFDADRRSTQPSVSNDWPHGRRSSRLFDESAQPGATVHEAAPSQVETHAS